AALDLARSAVAGERTADFPVLDLQRELDRDVAVRRADRDTPRSGGRRRVGARRRGVALLVGAETNLATVDEHALDLRVLGEDRLVADDDVCDLAALERSELAVDAEDARGPE